MTLYFVRDFQCRSRVEGPGFRGHGSGDDCARDPSSWDDSAVRDVLMEILRTIDRVENSGAANERSIVLRGFSWIVEPFEGQVVIAIEIPMGAAVAGPFAIDAVQLDKMIARVLRLSASRHSRLRFTDVRTEGCEAARRRGCEAAGRQGCEAARRRGCEAAGRRGGKAARLRGGGTQRSRQFTGSALSGAGTI